MSFDMSLARGLDYYTGIIYEAIHQSSAPPGLKTQPAVPAEASSSAPSKAKKAGEEDEVDESTVGVGSIAAGGRYDELVGMFSEAAGGKKGAGKVPCVGISVGVERVYSIILQKRKEREEREARGKETEVYIVSMGGNGLLKERMALAKDLWDGGIKVSRGFRGHHTHAHTRSSAYIDDDDSDCSFCLQAEFMYKNKPKPNAQLDACDRDQTPFTVILGPSEVETGTAKVRRQLGKEGGTTEGETVQRADLVEFLKRKLAEV